MYIDFDERKTRLVLSAIKEQKGNHKIASAKFNLLIKYNFENSLLKPSDNIDRAIKDNHPLNVPK